MYHIGFYMIGTSVMKELIYPPSANEHYGHCAKTVQIRVFFWSTVNLRVQSKYGRIRTRKNSVFRIFLDITHEYSGLDP